MSNAQIKAIISEASDLAKPLVARKRPHDCLSNENELKLLLFLYFVRKLDFLNLNILS